MLLSPMVAQATNGYFAHGYGVRNKSMGGVGAALSQDAITAAVNPAGMAFVDNRLDVELEMFSPHREYTVSGTPTLAPNTVDLSVNSHGFAFTFYLPFIRRSLINPWFA